MYHRFQQKPEVKRKLLRASSMWLIKEVAHVDVNEVYPLQSQELQEPSSSTVPSLYSGFCSMK